MLLPIVWMLLGLVTVIAAIRSRRDGRGVYLGRATLAVLFVLAGALVNLIYLLTGESYAEFAEGSYIPFVRDTWASLVVPNTGVFISLLVVFEAAVGIAVLLGGRWTQAALVAMIGFHLGLMTFGFGFWAWAIPMIAALAMLLRAERRDAWIRPKAAGRHLRRVA